MSIPPIIENLRKSYNCQFKQLCCLICFAHDNFNSKQTETGAKPRCLKKI